MNKTILFSVFSLLLVFSTVTVAGKKRCQPLLEKLQNIQAQQRQGYSVKKGISLQARADKAREKWWQCENRINKPNKKRKGQKKQVKVQYSDQYDDHSIVTEKAVKPFATSKPIVVKGRFSGKKQQAWLDYYQRPEKCKRPKTTQVFAFCMEHKAKQQAIFDKNYQPDHKLIN